MKIDTSRLKRGNSDVSPECQALIDRLRNCSRSELADELGKIDSWTFGKCELYHWIEVLDIFDGILEEATDIQRSEWHIEIDVNFSPEEVKLVLLVLNFTTLLIEHSFSRHLYSSIEHLSALLLSIDMEIVLGVLNLLYMFSKRSNYLSRLTGETRTALLGRLNFIAESWGGREYGLGLAECCHHDAKLPPTATIFYYEFYNKRGDLETINIDDARGKFSDPRDLTVHLLQRSTDRLSDEQRIHLFMRLRSSMRFHEHQARLQFVQARLQALSVLVYSDAIHEKTHSLIYPGFLEELVELLELNGKDLVEIHAAALRTMTSIIHLDRNPTLPKKPSSRLGMIIDVTGANSYHGFLPTLVRGCICSLTAPQETFPLPLATALFSFLYHLATYEVGGESLVACGMMESLLKVINWQGSELEHITFVTRAVRVIDLITNIDMASFQAHAGLSSFIGRLEVEVKTCRTDQPDEIIPKCRNTENIEGVLGPGGGESGQGGSITEVQSGDTAMIDASDTVGETSRILHQQQHRISSVCLPQRAALLKSMLNFLKKAIQDRAFAESIPHVMEGSLPNSLRHIISNAEYYGPSLFLLATDVVTVYVFQEPSLLSALQDNGLTDVVLQALLQKDVPATREVLGSLPNVFSALCLNGRGLEAFLAYNPFDRLFRVLLSPNYLPAMRRRRSSIGDTATNLGSAVDEFMRHHPRLTVAATVAIVKLLKDLVELGSSGRFMCWRPPAAAASTTTSRDAGSGQGSGKKQTPQDAGSSDDEDDDEEEASTASQRYDASAQSASRQQVPLTDYIHNTMKFIDAILSKSNSDDHCREFVNQGGLQPLFQVLALPNLPVDCSVTALAQSVATVCKSIMSLAFEPMVLGIALEHLSEIVERLEPLQRRLEHPGGSVLLSELANCPDPEAAFATPAFTPLLHAISAAHGYIVMLVHVCRTGQNNVRTVSLQKWGQDSEQGLGLLRRLVQLYTALVWESTLLLALCTDDIIPQGCDFGKEDLDRLVRDDTAQGNANGDADADARSNGVTNAMENLTTSGEGGGIMEIDLTQSSTSSDQSIEGIGAAGGSIGSAAAASAAAAGASGASGSSGPDKNTSIVSSRLGRALAELFGLLVKLCVGSPLRQRRGQTIPTVPPCFAETSREIARVLSFTLVDGLSYDKLPPSPFPKMKFTYLICSIGFTMPMLFDERRYAFHLMLHKFVQEGGLRAFFEVFNWVLTTATPNNELPETTVEFMNEWLTLLERLINPKAILHTPHTLPTNQRAGGSNGGQRDLGDFDVVQYLIEVQRNAFNAIQQLRKIVSIHNFSDRMQEYTLVILRHIFRAEAIIKERQSERQSDDGEENVAGSTGMTSTDIAARIVVGTAPRRTGTTDVTPPQQPVNPQHLRQLMDMGFSHDHCTAALRQATSVEQATELLLSMPIATERAPPERNMDVDMGEEEQYIHAILMSLKEMPDNLVEGSTIAADAETEPETPIPLATDELDRWADGAVYICLNIIDTMPTLVSRALDLLITIAKRNGTRWRDDMLMVILDEVANCLGYYEKYLSKATPRQAFVSLMSNKPISEKTDNRLHLLRLMLDPHQGHDLLSGPKWFPHLAIIFKQIEQVAVLLEHRQSIMMRGTWRTWKWYDVATAQWNTFSMVNNRTINEAFTNGESSVRIRSGRHRFTVNFGCMSQVNEETGAYQPVIMAIERNGGSSYVSIGSGPIRGIEQFDVKMILEILIDLLPLSIDTSVKYSLMKTCLRITRNFQYAKYFAQNGGIEALLRMRHVPGNNDFLQIALLLIRHTVEEPKTLELAMESVIVSRLVPNIPAGYRDLIYLTRQLSGAVARCPEMYVRVAKRMLRLDTTSTTARRSTTASGQHDDDEPKLLVKLASTSTGQQSTTSRVYTVEDRVTHDVISALLSALIATDTTAEFDDKSPNPADSDDGDRSSNTAQIPDDDDNDSSMADDRISHGRSPRWTTNTAPPTTDTQDTNRLLISKGVLLRFLSDLVRSYQTVALIVAEYTIPKGEANLTKDTPLLAYLIDTFIPWTDSNQDRECNASARMLVSSLAAMSGVGRIQSILIHELKSALVRTWHMNLARVTQQVDFAHPHTIATLNAVLKPLETLLRLTNQPTLSVVTRRRGGHQQRNARRTSAPRPTQIIEGGHVDVIVSTVIWPQENGSSDRPAVASSSSSATTQVSASVAAGGVAGDGGGTGAAAAAGGGGRVDGDAGGGGGGGAGEQGESAPWEENEEGNDAAWQDLYTMESSSDSEESESAGGEENAEPADMENEEEEEHEEAEPEEPSDVEVDEETRQFVEMYEQHVYGMRSPTFVEIERGSGGSDVGGPSGSGGGPDTEDINMIQYPRVGVTSGNSNVIDTNDAETPDGAGSSHDIARDTSSPRVYFHAMYDDTGDSGGRGSQITRDGTTAAAPTTAAGNLQLLMGSSTQQNLTPDGTGANGGGGAVAQRNRVRRYHYLRSIAARNTTQPVILQRLLGPSSHPSTSSAPFRDATRVVLMDNGFGIFSPQASGQNEEGAIDVVDSGWGQSGNLQGLSGGEHSSEGVMPLLGQYSSAMDRQGNAFLDQEALASLLVMLFIDAPKFNVLRFQRVIRNLCFHAPTRRWIIGALLAIMERTAEVVDLASTKKVSSGSPGHDPMESINSIGKGRKGQMSSSSSSTDMSCSKKPIERPMWLNIRLDPALGSRANVFIYCNTTKKLLLHPQAANSTCRHALELLTLLAKTFAAYFMPTNKDDTAPSDASATTEAGPSRPAAASGTTSGQQDDFWSILVRLDNPGGRIAPSEPQKRTPGYPTVRATKQIPVTFTDAEPKTFDEAPFGRLVAMLRAPNIRKSRPLTDKLLRLLAYMSIALPTDGDSDDKKAPSFIKNYSVGILETIVDVLSEKSCSEDGLDNIANLLVNLSHCSTAIRDNIIKLLLNAVKELAQLLEEQIKKLMDELKMADLDAGAAATATTTVGTSDGGVGGSAEEPSRRGTLQDRFTREVVVVSSEGRPRATGDLQLPSMAPLVAKTSNQTFFLRTLKIIFQIRRVEKESDDTSSGQFRDIHQLRQYRLWQTLSDCLELLKQTHDHHAVLVFQCAVEAFFLTHAPARRTDGTTQENRRDVFQEVMQPMSPIALNFDTVSESSDTPQCHNSPPFIRHHAKFLRFAEKHRTVLNQILRQYTTHLADGPFAVLVDHTRILDFDVKRRYFRTELERCDEGIRREELAIHVNRMNVFEDSFRELYRRSPEEWKNRFYIAFEDEEGQDAGGLLREWYVIISREIFNPNYALFTVSPGDRVTYMINPSSHANSNHLCYYKFVGRVIAKAIYDNKLLECYFTRSLYKHILGIRVKYTDMESEDYDFYKGLVYLKENNITTLGCELTFSLELQEFGVTEIRDLITNGRNIPVTEENKLEYIRLVCQLKMSGSIKQQLAAFLEGFYDIIPKRLISIFNEQELELLISGLPNVDIEDLRANTEYHKYTKFLQFVTGTSKVPLQGFAALEGMNGIQKFQIHRDDRGTDRLPSAHTCFNQLDLPVYKTYDKLRECLYKAIHECSEGFGFA
uniref:HECT-type E3 ubiquitin transferase n=1 Tax=Phlebotomus papatasi TaxID=29031 RepID=A0A1B0DQ42_PHLPP